MGSCLGNLFLCLGNLNFVLTKFVAHKMGKKSRRIGAVTSLDLGKYPCKFGRTLPTRNISKSPNLQIFKSSNHLLRHPATLLLWLICNLCLSPAATSSSARTRNFLPGNVLRTCRENKGTST